HLRAQRGGARQSLDHHDVADLPSSRDAGPEPGDKGAVRLSGGVTAISHVVGTAEYDQAGIGVVYIRVRPVGSLGCTRLAIAWGGVHKPSTDVTVGGRERHGDAATRCCILGHVGHVAVLHGHMAASRYRVSLDDKEHHLAAPVSSKDALCI